MILLGISVALVIVAGLMSGLTLGLMSLDKVDMEVLKRSGTATEKKYAKRIVPLIENGHFLLVTLLLVNACAMEALPLFLDRLADPVTAIIVSVTAVLMFGEIVPQALCSKFGLAIGANLAWFVRALMLLTSPISYPVSKVLDWVLGSDHVVLFRRTQLKALAEIHGEQELGGQLTTDEIKVITGALDLTNKTAAHSMTPLDKVFCLSTEDKLDDATLTKILENGHSRVPVHRAGDPLDIVGLVLVKELLQYRSSEAVPVSMLRLRSLPRLPAATAMYDMLKLFRTGRSHMAVLTSEDLDGNTQQPACRHSSKGTTAPGMEGHIHGTPFTTPDMTPLPLMDHSSTGKPVGIITIEDIIEELMQVEILDETDRFMDNQQLHPVDPAMVTNMIGSLPLRVQQVLMMMSEAVHHDHAATSSGGVLVRQLSRKRSMKNVQQQITHRTTDRSNDLVAPLLASTSTVTAQPPV